MAKKTRAVSVKSSRASAKGLAIGDALRYPWGVPGRLWNILWILVPILGIFALAGYGIRIAQAIIRGNKSELPPFGGFWDNCRTGFMLIIRLVPVYIIVALLGMIPFVGQLLNILISLFIMPYLVLNTMMKQNISASFAFSDALNAVTKDIGGYIMVVLKTIVYYLVYGLACLILIGIPCLAFGGIIFYAEWFSSNSK
ncbi:TPA: DUF4013 domain-containing protein [Candidatus Woesearchaeota archaeon]|nr:DUF4013 domain-containing protein [Candidatus Woesearchaeota archaeon]